MAEQLIPTFFDFKEIVTAMIREKGITEGIWQIFVEFKIVAAHRTFGDENDPESPKGTGDGPAPLLLPTAIVPVRRMGLIQVPVLSPLAVDACKVKPLKAAKKK